MKPFNVQARFRNLLGPFPEPKDFITALSDSNHIEKQMVARLWLSEGIPYAFKHCPMLYESIRGWLAKRFEIHPKEITIIGSARIGYSISPQELGRTFNTSSDLDFCIISKSLFERCVEGFQSWSSDYSKGLVTPRYNREKFFWSENFKNVPKNIDNGFIDPYKIPTWDKYPIAKLLEQTKYEVEKKLESTRNAPITNKSSFRVYSNLPAFIRQLTINLKVAIESLH